MPNFLTHKKFQIAIITALAVFLAQFAASFAETNNLMVALLKINYSEITAPILVAIGAQGIADLGKERAKIQTMAKNGNSHLRSGNPAPDLPGRWS